MTDSKNISWPGWETVKLIGRGSFGAVYEIQRDVLGDIEKAALKVISIPQYESEIDEMYSDGYDDESITSTFQNHLKSIVAEYTLMNRMSNCTNIVHCDDIRYVQHEDGIGWDIFIKMELLTPLIRALPVEIPEEMVVKIATDLCTALARCHKQGVIHRDIKPRSIFRSPNGDFKLGDFGIAKTVEKTVAGTRIGMCEFMAPEIYSNQPYGMSADIYSLGLVLYWLLNERRMPFLPLPPEKVDFNQESGARYRRFSGEPLPAPAHGSERLKRIVLKACAFDRRDRYQSAVEMLHDLNEGFGSEAELRRKEEARRRDREEQERLRKEREEQERLQRELSEQERLRKEREAQAQQGEKKRTVYKKWYIAIALIVVGVICGVLFASTGGQKTGTQQAAVPAGNAETTETVVITADNWSEYFTITQERVDHSTVLDTTAMYAMDIHYRIELKDRYEGRIDDTKVSKINFSLTYQECFGVFDVNFKTLTYTEPDSFSTISNHSADLSLIYPHSELDASNIIYTGSFLGSEPNDSGLGYVAKNFEVTSASGTLYLGG